MRISQAITFFLSVVYLLVIVRIIFGPFPLFGVVGYHYAMRISSVSLLYMLTFNRLLTSAFVLKFAVPEKQILISMGVFTVITTVASIIHDALLRQSLGLDHFGRVYFFLYLGKECAIYDRKQAKCNVIFS